MMLTRPNRLLSSVPSTLEQCYVLPNHFLISSTYTDKNSPLSRFANKQSQVVTFPNSFPIGLMDIPFRNFSPSNAPTKLPRMTFPTRVLSVGVRTDFVREEPLDFQC